MGCDGWDEMGWDGWDAMDGMGWVAWDAMDGAYALRWMLTCNGLGSGVWSPLKKVLY